MSADALDGFARLSAKVAAALYQRGRREVRDDTQERLQAHVYHEVEIVNYGLTGQAPVNVSLECLTCGVVIMDRDL